MSHVCDTPTIVLVSSFHIHFLEFSIKLEEKKYLLFSFGVDTIESYIFCMVID